MERLKIVSGGQTGADRAGLDWAINNSISHGGWCPKGRKAEDGPIDGRYQLQETPSSNYSQRTGAKPPLVQQGLPTYEVPVCS